MIKYKITYPEFNVTQIKNLIDHSIHLKGKEIGNTPIPSKLNKQEIKEFYKKVDKLKKDFLKPYGNYFTTESPLYKAIKTKILDCNKMKIKVKFEII